MTVLTTVMSRSRPSRERSSAHTAMIWSPSTSSPVWSIAIKRSASPSRASPKSARSASTAAARARVSVAPQRSLMLRPSGESWITTTSAPALRKSGAAIALRRAVRRVDDDAQPSERTAADRRDARARRRRCSPRCRRVGRARRWAHRARRRRARPRASTGSGSFVPAAGEQLDAVVAVGVVRRRDHRADGVATLALERDHRRGHDAEAVGDHALGSPVRRRTPPRASPSTRGCRRRRPPRTVRRRWGRARGPRPDRGRGRTMRSGRRWRRRGRRRSRTSRLPLVRPG